MENYKVDKGVPISINRFKKDSKFIKYPIRDMEISDSFLIPCSKDDMERIRLNVWSACTYYSRADGIGKRFITRWIEGEGLRVWRVL